MSSWCQYTALSMGLWIIPINLYGRNIYSDMEHDKIKLPSSPFENHSTKIHNSHSVLLVLLVTNQDTFHLRKPTKPLTLLLVYIGTLKVLLAPALTDSIHMSRFLFQDDKPSSHCHFDVLSVHLYHWTCLLALSCPLLWSLHVPIARHPKHVYLYLPSSSSSILLLLPHPKAPST